MGCGGSTPADGEPQGGGAKASGKNYAEDLKDKLLQEELERQQAEEARVVKLLVLGTGESGKSTVFKQMKILYSVPDPPSKYIMICRANLFGNANAVFDGMERLGISFSSDAAKASAKILKDVPPDGNPENIDELKGHLSTTWGDSGVKEAIDRAAEYQLNDSTIYFWERAEELCKPDYMPSEQDVLRARVRTTGIVQHNFQIKDKKYTMFDVGGQRNERRKWIHCFDNVTAVIFVTAISEYDQVLYEDENTNRMDEAVQLFEQICNHPSFKKTSMILFLNKRDLFEMKLKKKDMSCWKPEAGVVGQDYDRAILYLKEEFLKKNKDPANRQVYCHPTCATDTNNVSFVMESVFDIILKENLRKLATGNVEQMLELASGSGVSEVKLGPAIWEPEKQGRIILAAAYFTENLAERKVMVNAERNACLPAVQVATGLSISAVDWDWLQGLGRDLPTLPVFPAESGSFKGDFKEAMEKLRGLVGTEPQESLGSCYDMPIQMFTQQGSKITLVVVVKVFASSANAPAGYTWVEHEVFENTCYKEFDGRDTVANPCMAPAKNQEFNPFAANDVGFRWFKGVTLYTKECNRLPDKGVYLGVFKVLNSADGFKVMVNEHNRIAIPMIFLTESQLNAEETEWMHGVRTREVKFGIDLLEGKQPNRGWLGPEMSGEEGATFPEKLWWAIDEAKARLGLDEKASLGLQYDRELLFTDEENNCQLLIYAILAQDSSEVLPGHIWVNKSVLQVQNMKYLCPKVLKGVLAEQQKMIDEIVQISANMDGVDMDSASKIRAKKGEALEKLKEMLKSQTPLKWVDRVIMWCAEKMPSLTDSAKGSDATSMVRDALSKDTDLKETAAKRAALIAKYKN